MPRTVRWTLLAALACAVGAAPSVAQATTTTSASAFRVTTPVAAHAVTGAEAIEAVRSAFHLNGGGRIVQARVDAAMSQLYGHWRELTPSQRALAQSWFARPTDPNDVNALIRYTEPEAPPFSTPQGHFVVHYINNPADLDSPDLTDVMDASGNPVADGVPDWVDQVGIAAEQAYAYEVGTLGFAPPPPDAEGPDAKYDIYIVDFNAHHQQGLLGLTTNDETGDHKTSSLDVDDDYTQAEMGGSPIFGVDELRVTVAHEFFHGIQMGYLADTMPSWLAESTATYMESLVWPLIPDNYGYLPAIVGKGTEEPFTTQGDLHEYGLWWWITFMSKHTKARAQFVSRLLLRLEHTNPQTEGVTAVQQTAGGQHTLSKLMRLFALKQAVTTTPPFAVNILPHATGTLVAGTQLVLPITSIKPMEIQYWKIHVPSRHVVVTVQSVPNRIIKTDIGLVLGGPKGKLAFGTHQIAKDFWRIKGTIPVGRPKVVEIAIVHVRFTVLPYRISVAAH